MTHTSSRKQFFAKLLGVVAAASVFPKAFAKPAAAVKETPAGASNAVRRFELRHDARTVARRDTI